VSDMFWGFLLRGHLVFGTIHGHVVFVLVCVVSCCWWVCGVLFFDDVDVILCLYYQLMIFRFMFEEDLTVSSPDVDDLAGRFHELLLKLDSLFEE